MPPPLCLLHGMLVTGSAGGGHICGACGRWRGLMPTNNAKRDSSDSVHYPVGFSIYSTAFSIFMDLFKPNAFLILQFLYQDPLQNQFYSHDFCQK